MGHIPKCPCKITHICVLLCVFHTRKKTMVFWPTQEVVVLGLGLLMGVSG